MIRYLLELSKQCYELIKKKIHPLSKILKFIFLLKVIFKIIDLSCSPQNTNFHDIQIRGIVVVNLGTNILLKILTGGLIRMIDRDLISLIDFLWCLYGFSFSKQKVLFTKLPLPVGKADCSQFNSCWESTSKSTFHLPDDFAWDLTRENDPSDLIMLAYS